jgi:hypothetical protein
MTIDLGADLDEGLTVGLDDDLDDGLIHNHDPVAAVRLRRRRRGGGRRPPLQRMRHRPAAPPENFYPDVAAFVTGFLAELYAHEWRETDTSWRWCAQWWAHTEAWSASKPSGRRGRCSTPAPAPACGSATTPTRP